MKKRRRTRIQRLFINTVVFLLLLFAGCNSTAKEDSSFTATPSIAAPTNAPVAVLPSEETVEEGTTEMFLSEPRFSTEGGFYRNAFLLTLFSAPGTEIYYTTDGTDPRFSATAFLYTREIQIYNNTNQPNVYSAVTDISLNGYWPPNFKVDKGIVIRAVAKEADGTYGPVATQSYFVGKDSSYYNNMRVISMVTDGDYLFNPDTGAYMIGSQYYEWKSSNKYVAFDPSDVQNPTNYNAGGRESEFPVTIQVFEQGTPVYTIDVGARIAGNWTRSGVQKSFRFYARKEYGKSKMKYSFFDGLTDISGEEILKFDKVSLWNGGNDHILHFRDAFMQDIAKGTGIDYMASEPCILFINGEFWGFYLLREKPDDYYIQSHYGIDDKSVTVIKNGGLETGTEAALEEYRSFCKWASTADMTVESNYREFCEKMDVYSFMTYIAIETYLNNSDCANGYLNNWMVWRSETKVPEIERADGKWRFILYDLDITAGLYGNTETSFKYDSLSTIRAKNYDFNFPSMLRNLSKNEDFLNEFYNVYLSVIEDCFAVEKVGIKLTSYLNAYQEVTKATHYRFGNNWAAENYEEEAQALLDYFKHRPLYAKYYLDIFCGRELPGNMTLP